MKLILFGIEMELGDIIDSIMTIFIFFFNFSMAY